MTESKVCPRLPRSQNVLCRVLPLDRGKYTDTTNTDTDTNTTIAITITITVTSSPERFD